VTIPCTPGWWETLLDLRKWPILRRSAAIPNVILLSARDKGLLYLPPNARESLHLPEQDGPQPVSPVQLYLDMRAAGGRHAEQAATLREEVLGY